MQMEGFVLICFFIACNVIFDYLCGIDQKE